VCNVLWEATTLISSRDNDSLTHFDVSRGVRVTVTAAAATALESKDGQRRFDAMQSEGKKKKKT